MSGPDSRRPARSRTAARNKTGKDQRGSSLLVTMVLGLELAASATVAALESRGVARELRARRDALCARYAVLSGIALGPFAHDVDGPALISPDVATLEVSLDRDGDGVCMLRIEASCGQARRRVERPQDDGACD